MKSLGSCLLLEHEWGALKDALKRDVDREIEKARVDENFLDWHMYNARIAQRLLNLMDSYEMDVMTRVISHEATASSQQ